MFYDLLRCTRVWRNWQTRKIQVLMTARTCRFDPCYPHQTKIKRTREKILSSFFRIGCRARIIRHSSISRSSSSFQGSFLKLYLHNFFSRCRLHYLVKLSLYNFLIAPDNDFSRNIVAFTTNFLHF